MKMKIYFFVYLSIFWLFLRAATRPVLKPHSYFTACGENTSLHRPNQRQRILLLSKLETLQLYFCDICCAFFVFHYKFPMDGFQRIKNSNPSAWYRIRHGPSGLEETGGQRAIWKGRLLESGVQDVPMLSDGSLPVFLYAGNTALIMSTIRTKAQESDPNSG